MKTKLLKPSYVVTTKDGAGFTTFAFGSISDALKKWKSINAVCWITKSYPVKIL